MTPAVWTFDVLHSLALPYILIRQTSLFFRVPRDSSSYVETAIQTSTMPGGLHPPLAVIASWPKPNFVDPEVRGNGLLVGSVILVTSAFLVVCGRLWSRLVILHQGGIDDVLIVVAMVRMCCILDRAMKLIFRFEVFSTALLIVVTLGELRQDLRSVLRTNGSLATGKFGWDRHVWDVNPKVYVVSHLVSYGDATALEKLLTRSRTTGSVKYCKFYIFHPCHTANIRTTRRSSICAESQAGNGSTN